METLNDKTVIVRGKEHGEIIEFTAGNRVTAEKLVEQLREQGLTELMIEKAH